MHRFLSGLALGTCLLLTGCSSGPDQDLKLAKSTIENLIRGESKVEDQIDWEMLHVNDEYVGEAYNTLPDEKQKSVFRRQFINGFSSEFLKAGRGVDAAMAALENWRVVNRDSARTVIAFDNASKETITLTVSRRDGMARLSAMAMGSLAKDQILVATADNAKSKGEKTKRKSGDANQDSSQAKEAEESTSSSEPSYRSVHAKELEVLGSELRNQKFQMVGRFLELNDTWVKKHQFSDAVGIFFTDEKGVTFQRAIADKKRFAKLLLEYKRGDRVRFIGHVQEFLANYNPFSKTGNLGSTEPTFYLIVDAIRDYPARAREEGERLEREDDQVRLAAQAALDRQKEQKKAAQVQRAKDAAMKAQYEKDRPKIEAMAAAGREKRNAMLEKTNKLLRLKESREAAERTLPLIGQNGKTLMQAIEECEEILSKPESLGELPGFPSPVRKQLADLKDQAAALRGKGIEVATKSIAELESQLTSTGKNAQSNQIRISLHQDLERMKKYKALVVDWEQKIADAQK